jgi:hypothetical protein
VPFGEVLLNGSRRKIINQGSHSMPAISCNYSVANDDNGVYTQNFRLVTALTGNSHNVNFFTPDIDTSQPAVLAFLVSPVDPNTDLCRLDLLFNGNDKYDYTFNYTTTAFRTMHVTIFKNLGTPVNKVQFSLVSGWGALLIVSPVMWYRNGLG